MKIYFHFIGLIGLIALASCTSKTDNSTGQEYKTVKIDTVRTASSLSVLQFPGRVKAAHDINIAFRVSGTIERIYVNEGAKVRKGQLLARLDTTDYAVQLKATEAEYQQVKGEAERVIALYNEGGTTPVAYDKARYGLQQIEAKYKNHKDMLAYAYLYAPFDGYVQKTLFDEHETVAAGMPVISIISQDTPEVELNLPASEYIRRNTFEKFSCTLDIYPGKEYPLQLIGITEKANANQLYAIHLKMDKSVMPLPSPGMNTMVSIYCRTEGQAIYSVPGSAVWQQDGQTYIYIYQQDNGQVLRTEVECLRLTGNGDMLLRGEGLKAGDCVVSSGVHHINNGEKVKALPPVSATNEGGLL